MKFLHLFLLLLTTAWACADTGGPVYVIPVRSEITGPQSLFLRRALKEAERHNASAVVLDMDTFGGGLSPALDEMDALLKTSVPTFTFIDSKAISAGALITLATRHVYITPQGIIGAAAPVDSTGGDIESTMRDKTVSMMTAKVRGAAEKCGHNPDLADAFIRKEAQLKIGDVVLDGPDTLLSMDAKEATRKFDGKPVLAEGIAGSLTEMLRQAELSGAVHEVTPTGFEHLAIWLNMLAPILLLGGIIGAYTEFKMPGFGLPGIISIVCFTLFFAGSYVAGLSGWEAIVLFMLGFVLVLSEVFLHPGTVLPGVAGLVMMLLSLLWAMVDRFPSDPLWPTGDMLMRPLLNLCFALVGAGIAIFFLAKYLPQTSFFRRIVLAETDPPGRLVAATVAPLLAGATGMVKTTLRPSGKAEFEGQVFDVVSQGEFIPAGQAVRVVTVAGSRVVVQPV